MYGETERIIFHNLTTLCSPPPRPDGNVTVRIEFYNGSKATQLNISHCGGATFAGDAVGLGWQSKEKFATAATFTAGAMKTKTM